MFGIGFGELLICAIILLIAIGPDKLPHVMRTFGKVMRQTRRVTRDLRDATGIDEMLADYDDPVLTRKIRNAPQNSLSKETTVPEKEVLENEPG